MNRKSYQHLAYEMAPRSMTLSDPEGLKLLQIQHLGKYSIYYRGSV